MTLLFILLGLLFAIFVISRPRFRCFISHIFSVCFFAIKDFVFYFLHRGWREAPIGYIDMFCAEFGKGKTLSAVMKITQLYNRYNDKIVWDLRQKMFVTQKIVILSNVKLSIPFVEFVSMQQFINFCDSAYDDDIRNKTRTVLYVLGDEFNTQMNSRNFKSNISPTLLNNILTCRHHNAAFILTAQRFNQCDALLRQVTRFVIDCNKSWRFMVHQYYRGWQLENCNNPLAVKPEFVRSCFVYDKSYRAYDTFACVDNLVQDYKSGAYASDQEILALQGAAPDHDYDSVPLRKKFLKKIKKSA